VQIPCGKDKCDSAEIDTCSRTYKAECQVEMEEKQELLDFGFKCENNQWYWEGKPYTDKKMDFKTAKQLFKSLEASKL